RLKNLDGEALLNTMHDMQDRDSLVYWLEFKDDEEFPSPRFGSIAGGSAFKFGLFRRKETGKWTTGSPQNPEELTVEQAIEKARQHREQLIRGIELLDKMPANGTDEDYAQLQRDMNYVAIGLAGTSDLSTITNDKAGKETIRKALLSHDPQMNHSVAGRIAQQLFHFRWTIAPGDLVLASNGATVLGIGKVTGEY